jgi:outer membrane biosynthesis protein TonB
VSSDPSGHEQSLREQVEQSEQSLDTLERELRAVDAELEQLAQQHPRYELLTSICSSLEELDRLGAAKLFWKEDGSSAEQAQRIAYAREQSDQYGRDIVRVETRREAIVEKIGTQNSQLDYLHYDMQDMIEQQENRNSEWLPERDEQEIPYHAQIMPWTRGAEEDRRLNRSLLGSLAASLAFAFLLSVVAVPIMNRPEDAKLPERVARLVREERLPPPPPPVTQPEPEIPDQPPEPEPELVDEAEPEPAPVQNEQPVLADVEQPDTREQVKSKGLLAFRDSFASRAELRPAAQLGSQARLSNAGENSTGRPERMMVTTSAPGSSGGINLADISRDFGGGGGGMDGVAVSRVASNIGGGDGPDRPLSSGASAGRTDEEIQIVFDRYKAALYRLYNRELRNDPTLRGQLVLQLTIEPDGSVSLCKLYASSMDAPMLANQVVDRVRSFDFGAKQDIVAVTIIYPIDFLPAA